MAWFYGKPMNDMPFQHNAMPLEFFASRCDFREGVYVVFPSDIEIKPETLIKATAQVMGYHATNIHKELNGFQGYGAIHYTLISPEEAEPIKQKLGLCG
tara:strand:+ start:3029 stop:3325 length:297 start_codon:yes stop_codon:yes gene_type:complete